MPPHEMFPDAIDIDLQQLCSLPYKEQAIWFMNGFWDTEKGGLCDNAEEIWRIMHHFAKLDSESPQPKGEAGNELDQFYAAKFLEENEETLTAVERKAALKEIDVDNNGKMALIEYLTFKFKKAVDDVLRAPQGAASEISQAQKIIDQALNMLPEIEQKLAAQKEALSQQVAALMQTKQAKVVADQSLITQSEAEADLKMALKMVEAAKQELEQAVNELRAQEEAVNKQRKDLEAKSQDMSAGIVARGKAASMLTALNNEDPMPLRVAKITQEAALRRVEKEQKHAMVKTIDAANKTELCKKKVEELHAKEKDLEEKKRTLDAAIQELEDSYNELSKRMTEAQAVIKELKGSESGLGAVWWMERSLYEADSALPQVKQKYNHRKPFEFNPSSPSKAPPSPIASYKNAGGKPPPNQKPTRLSFSTAATPAPPNPAAASTPPPAAQPTAPAVDSATADGADMPTDTAPAATATPPAEPVAVEAPAEPEAHYDAVLTYFPGRGRAEAIRAALSEIGLSWKHVLKTGPEFMDMKPLLAFGSLPLLEIDGLYLVQSGSILRYLARAHRLCPDTAASMWRFDALIDAAEDLRMANYKGMPAFGATADAQKNLVGVVHPRHAKQFDTLLGTDAFFVDNQFSLADIAVWDVLQTSWELNPCFLNNFPRLKAFVERINGRERIAAYLASDNRLGGQQPLECATEAQA